MNSKLKLLYIIKYWFLGTVLALFGYIVLSLVGWSKTGTIPAQSLHDIFNDFVNSPTSTLLTALLIGALIGFALGWRPRGSKSDSNSAP